VVSTGSITDERRGLDRLDHRRLRTEVSTRSATDKLDHGVGARVPD
jgi:hypothetical protein